MSQHCKYSQTFCCIKSCKNRPYLGAKTSIWKLQMKNYINHVTALQTFPNCCINHIMPKSTLSRRENVELDTADEVLHNSCHSTAKTPKLFAVLITSCQNQPYLGAKTSIWRLVMKYYITHFTELKTLPNFLLSIIPQSILSR